ncbi:MAG TPA: prolipoprotein diacylglyceryl transferase [Nitrospinae bacterium]|nr:prolipoprotein diacylglyceryl transferase [Nitrospinota bacterium]HBA27051.1 prolipoprotein diacylglyceryl transferase [Nitrospinota bacterium]
MHPILFKIGPITIYTYGVLIATAFFLGLALAARQARVEGEDPQKIMDLSFYILISAIAGSRLLYIVVEYKEYISNPLRIFKVWEGGLVFYGGFIIAMAVVIIYIKKNEMSLWKVGDILAPSVAIGQGVGRLGCFFAGCCYGRETDVPWAVIFKNPNTLAPMDVHLHPTQLYDSANGFIIFAILLILRKFKKFDGQLFWTYTLLYAVGRFIVEIFRGDERGFVTASLSTSQFIAIPLFAVSIVMLIKLKRRKIEG